MMSRCLCAKIVQQYFMELIFVIFRPRDMREYIFIFSIALEWR